MKTYEVEIPIAGSICIEVEAEDREAAIKAAWESIDINGEGAGEITWEYYEQITRGNVLYAPLNEIEVVEA